MGKALTAEQKTYLETNKDKFNGKIYIVGGTGAVSDSVKAEVEAYIGAAERFAGSNRYETAKMVADAFFDGELDTVVIASGKGFPDGLAGGPVALAYKAPLLLVADGVTAQAEEVFKDSGAHTLVVMGGTGVVSKDIAETIADPATEE